MDLSDLKEDLGDSRKEFLTALGLLGVVVLIVFFSASLDMAEKPAENSTDEKVDFTPPTASRNYSTSLSVADQELVNGSFQVSAQNTEPYYIVIHRDAGGYPGEVLGHSELLAGRVVNKPVVVGDVEGSSFYAVLHGFDGDNKFEPEQDKPIKMGNETALNVFGTP